MIQFIGDLGFLKTFNDCENIFMNSKSFSQEKSSSLHTKAIM